MTIFIDQEIIRLKTLESYGTQTTPKKAPINSKHYSKELLGTPKNSRVYSRVPNISVCGNKRVGRKNLKKLINVLHVYSGLQSTPRNSIMLIKSYSLQAPKKMRSLGMKGKPNDPKILKKVNVS